MKLKYATKNLDNLREPISAEIRERNNPIYYYYGASGIIDKIDYYNVDDTVLLIGEDGANLITRNLPLVYKANGKFWVNNHAHILKTKQNNYAYMAFLLECVDYTTFITGSAQPKLSQENLDRVLLPIPPLPEQHTIAAYLGRKTAQIDGMIAKREKQIELLEEMKTAIISQAVTKGLDPKVKMKDSGVEWIGRIPEGWEVNALKRIITLLTDYDANGSFADLAKNVKINIGIPFAWMVRATDLSNNRHGIVDGNNYCDESTYRYLKKSSLAINDILIAKRGEIGKSYVVPPCDCPMTLAPNTYLLKINKTKIDGTFFHFFFLSQYGKKQLEINHCCPKKIFRT
jgi:type I restriction enzyme S subunit